MSPNRTVHATDLQPHSSPSFSTGEAIMMEGLDHGEVDSSTRAKPSHSPLATDEAWIPREQQLDELAKQADGAAIVTPHVAPHASAHVDGSRTSPPDAAAIERLQRALVEAARAQLGGEPHTRVRHVGVSKAFDGLPLRVFLERRYPHVDAERWREAATRGDLSIDGRRADLDRTVRAGARFEHVEHEFQEPEIATDLRVLWADRALWVVHKPAPMPVHPCGRYGHNTFTAIAQRAVAALDPDVLATLDGARDWGSLDAVPDDVAARPVHRLDADTRGLLVVARSRAAARLLTRQWEDRQVLKLYRATVRGDARGLDGWWRGAIGLPSVGRAREVVATNDATNAQEAVTYVRVVDSNDDFQTTNLLVSPWSGRTNQLRVHLATMGFPILGDDDYGRPAARAGDDSDAATDDDGMGRVVTSGRALALAATHLEFTHPFDRRRLRFVCS